MTTRTRTRPEPPNTDRRQAGVSTVESIAHLVHQARPDWDEYLVRTVLFGHAPHVDANDLARAALAAAGNPNLPRPAAIGWRGPHWDGLATKPPRVAAPARCRVCGRPEPACYSVRPGPDDHAFEAE